MLWLTEHIVAYAVTGSLICFRFPSQMAFHDPFFCSSLCSLPVGLAVYFMSCIMSSYCITCFSSPLQVELMLNDRLLQFVNIDLHEVKVL